MPAIIVNIGATRLLLDCGDGTLARFTAYAGMRSVDVICLTEATGERLSGAIALLDALAVLDASSPRPKVMGPPGTVAALSAIGQLMASAEPTEVTEVSGEITIPLDHAFLTVAPLDRPTRPTSLGYRFHEHERRGRFDLEAARAKGLTPGPDFGRLAAGEIVKGVSPEEVMGPPRAGRRLGIAGPSRPGPALERLALDSDVLVVPCHFIDERLELAVAAGSCTGSEAALVAAAANVDSLVLTHTSAGTAPSYACAEAAQFHSNTIVPSPADAVLIPFPEKGLPQWARQPQRRQRYPR